MGATFHVSISPMTAGCSPSKRVLARGIRLEERVAKPQFSMIVIIVIITMATPTTNPNRPANLPTWEQAIRRSGRVNIGVGDSCADCFQDFGKLTCGDSLVRRSDDVIGDDRTGDSYLSIGVAGWTSWLAAPTA